MFGIIYGLANIGARIVGNIQDAVIDNEHKKTMYDPATDTYLDHRYSQRDMKTNQLRHESVVDGDKCLMAYSNRGAYVVRNLDKERREHELKHLKDSNRTVVQYNLDQHVTDKCAGVRFVDGLNPSRLLVIREFKENDERIGKSKVYMDIKTGLAVRITDGEIKRQNESAHHLEEELDELWKTDKKAYNDRISGLRPCMKKYYYKIYRNSNGFHKVKYQNELIVQKFNENQERILKTFHDKDFIYYGNRCGAEVDWRLNYEWKRD